AVTFSSTDLKRLGIAPEDTAPFILATESRSRLASQSMGHSDLVRYPLVQVEDDLIMAAPHVVTASVRRYIVERLAQTGFLGFFAMFLHTRQAKEWFETLRHSFHFEPVNVDLPKPPEDFPAIYQTLMSFDEGKYAHLILLDGNLRGQLTNAHEMDRVSDL